MPANAEDSETILGAVVWASSDEAVATVVDGTITLVTEGTADVTATSGAFTATVKVTVNPAS